MRIWWVAQDGGVTRLYNCEERQELPTQRVGTAIEPTKARERKSSMGRHGDGVMDDASARERDERSIASTRIATIKNRPGRDQERVRGVAQDGGVTRTWDRTGWARAPGCTSRMLRTSSVWTVRGMPIEILSLL